MLTANQTSPLTVRQNTLVNWYLCPVNRGFYVNGFSLFGCLVIHTKRWLGQTGCPNNVARKSPAAAAALTPIFPSMTLKCMDSVNRMLLLWNIYSKCSKHLRFKIFHRLSGFCEEQVDPSCRDGMFQQKVSFNGNILQNRKNNYKEISKSLNWKT